MARAKKPRLTPTVKPSFWENPKVMGKIALWSLITTLLLGIIGFIQSHYLGNPSREKDSRELESLETQNQSSPDPGCGFPAHFVRDTLYVLITRFEDTQEESAENPYGKNIERRIDILSDSLRKRIVFCYRKELSPNQRRDADFLRDKFHADLVIWGKLKNASSKCNSEGFCIQFEPSDSLITYAGGTVPKPRLDDYQFGISADDLETELIRMGNEIFDDWLVGMFNLKIGRQKPDLFVIGEGWDKKKKAEAYFTRGNIWSGLGRYSQAISDYNIAIVIDPKYSAAYNERGSAKINLGHQAEGVADYDQAISIDPNFSKAYGNKGIAKLRFGHNVEAISAFNKAIAIDSKDASVYTNRGVAKFNLHKYVEAILDLDQAIAIDSSDFHIYNNRGAAKIYLGRFAEAISDFDQALSLNQKDASAYNNRGAAKRNLGRYAEAIYDLDIAIQNNPKNANAYYNRGLAKLDLGRFSGAIADFSQSNVLNYSRETQFYLETARHKLEIKNKERRRNYALTFLFFTLVYIWKFKTINHLFIRAYQNLKKLHRP